MTPQEYNDYIELLKKFYQRADKICAENPHADREMLVQVMHCLRRPPDQNLGYALFRTGKISSYPKGKSLS